MQGIQESQVCRDRLQDGLNRSVKRDSGFAIGHDLAPFSIKGNRLQPVMVYWGVCVLAMTIWHRFGQFVFYIIALVVGYWSQRQDQLLLPTDPLLLLYPLGFDYIFNPEGTRWRQRPFYAVFMAIVATWSAFFSWALSEIITQGTGPTIFRVCTSRAVSISFAIATYTIIQDLTNLINFSERKGLKDILPLACCILAGIGSIPIAWRSYVNSNRSENQFSDMPLMLELMDLFMIPAWWTVISLMANKSRLREIVHKLRKTSEYLRRGSLDQR